MTRVHPVLLALITACGPQPGTSTEDTAVTTSGTVGDPATTTASVTTGHGDCGSPHEATDDCCCFTFADGELHNACPSAMHCPHVAVWCDGWDASCPLSAGGMGEPPPDFTVEDEAALDCSLALLRDGLPGLVSWGFNEGDSRTFRNELHPRTDRTAFTYRIDIDDLGVNVGAVTLQALRPAAFFADCLAAPDIRTRALCLEHALVPEITATCAEPP